MTMPLTLTISTPLDIVVHVEGVTSFRASDDSGSFGILPGHLRILTLLRSSVVRWHCDAEPWAYCAVAGGVMSVENGTEIRIACRQAVVGSDLAALESAVGTKVEEEIDAARRARVLQARMHARAIRQIMLHMRGESAATQDGALEEMFR
jgi:F-type H+-transporting ATPase subunit epsilon